MKTDNKIKDEKLQYDINREAANSALSPGKTDKQDYLTCEELLPSGQSREIEQATFKYSPLGKPCEKLLKIKE